MSGRWPRSPGNGIEPRAAVADPDAALQPVADEHDVFLVDLRSTEVDVLELTPEPFEDLQVFPNPAVEDQVLFTHRLALRRP